eukprot:14630903-Ditylum_brightwellii.AAC.2
MPRQSGSRQRRLIRPVSLDGAALSSSCTLSSSSTSSPSPRFLRRDEKLLLHSASLDVNTGRNVTDSLQSLNFGSLVSMSSVSSIPLIPGQQQQKRRRKRMRRTFSSDTENLVRGVVLIIAVLSAVFSVGLIVRLSSSMSQKEHSVTSREDRSSVRRTPNVASPEQSGDATINHHEELIAEKIASAPLEDKPQTASHEKRSRRLIDESDAAKEEENFLFQTKTASAPSCSTPLSPSDVKFTLVTQFSSDRLWMFPYHCSRIPNDVPISMVVYTDKSVDDVYNEIEQSGMCHANFRNHTTVQTLSTQNYDKGEYPVNKLRNMALSAVQTSHVMYIDIDFWESFNLFSTLSSPSVTYELANDAQLAIVVPAFQLMRQCREYRECPEKNIPVMPSTQEELFNLVQEKQVFMFDPTNAGGHGSTLYKEWAMEQYVGDLLELPCIKSNRYEPYLAFRYCEELPPFQEQFNGYGK